MEVASELVGKVQIVSVHGDLDASNVQKFRNIVLPVLSSPIKLLIDLSDVPFIDSSGMGAMITCQRTAAAAGGSVRLCCMSKAVRTAFELIRLNHVLDIYDNKESALMRFSEV